MIKYITDNLVSSVLILTRLCLARFYIRVGYWFKLSNFRRSRGYSYEHSLVQRLNIGDWCARRLGGSSAGLPDIVAVNNKTSVLLSIEAKSGTGDALYIPQDQIRRCILIQNMFGYYKRRYTIFAFKFMRKKRFVRKGQTVYEPRKLVEYYKSIEKVGNIEAISMIKCTYDGKTYEFRNESFVESNLIEFPMPFSSASGSQSRSSIALPFMKRTSIGVWRLEEVCPICFRFLSTIYDKKRIKNVRVFSPESTERACNSTYHKKLTDSFRS